MVSANTATCTAPDVSTAGPRRRKNSRVAGSSVGITSPTPSPDRAASHQTSATCATPPASTPQAAAWAADGNQPAISSVAIIVMLSRIDAAAAAANRPAAFSTPDSSTTTDMQIR